jgi:protein-disulfide isomerase
MPTCMTSTIPTPSGHTHEGGVLIGSNGARRKLVVFEDPQCPYCRQFEEACGDMLRREVSAGAVSVEYRMRCFIGPESARADNALALAAEAGRFDQLRMAIFDNQPQEGTGGFTVEDLIKLGEVAGLTSTDYVAGVRENRYEDWVLDADERFQILDEQGTPAAFLDGVPVESERLYDKEALGALIRG